MNAKRPDRRPDLRLRRGGLRRLLPALCLALLVLSAAFLAWASHAIWTTRDDVTAAVTTLAGNPAAAEGLVMEQTIYTNISSGLHPFSDTAHTTGSILWELDHALGAHPAIRAEAALSAQRLGFSHWEPPALKLSSKIGVQNLDESILSTGQGAGGLTLAVQELYRGRSTGRDSLQKSIRLADYYDCYPIGGAVHIGGRELTWTGDPVFAGVEPAIAKAINDHIRIPVSAGEGLPLEVHFSGSDVSQISLSGQDYLLRSHCALGEDALYFTVSNRTEEGELVDTSRIPGGYGVYRLPYAVNGAGELTFGAVTTLCPLDEQARVVSLHLTDGALMAVTLTGQQPTLTRIDPASGQVAQTLPLPATERQYAYDRADVLLWGDGHLAVAFNDDRLALYAPGADGLWAYRFTAALPLSGDELWAALSSPHSPAVRDPRTPYLRYLAENTVTAWDGERLAVASRLQWYIGPDGGSGATPRYYGLLVGVYGAEGAQWLGHCATSLDPGDPVTAPTRPHPYDRPSVTLGWSSPRRAAPE